jgi:hypothetical protein
MKITQNFQFWIVFGGNLSKFSDEEKFETKGN